MSHHQFRLINEIESLSIKKRNDKVKIKSRYEVFINDVNIKLRHDAAKIGTSTLVPLEIYTFSSLLTYLQICINLRNAHKNILKTAKKCFEKNKKCVLFYLILKKLLFRIIMKFYALKKMNQYFIGQNVMK